jgi:hypothetical protein
MTGKTIAKGIEEAIMQIATTGAKNQCDSNQSHSVLVVFGRSLNQRVGGSRSSPVRHSNQTTQKKIVIRAEEPL